MHVPVIYIGLPVIYVIVIYVAVIYVSIIYVSVNNVAVIWSPRNAVSLCVFIVPTSNKFTFSCIHRFCYCDFRLRNKFITSNK